MIIPSLRNATSELGQALGRLRGGLAGVAVLSALINTLAITSSMYLMLVYDRVLPSQRLSTLFSVLAMACVVYVFSGVFEALRAHMLSDIGSAVDAAISPRAVQIDRLLALRRQSSAEEASPIRDLDLVRAFLASPGPAALIDLPWILFFLVLLSLVQIWLGVATLVGALVIATLTYAAERITRHRVGLLSAAGDARRQVLDRQRRHVELIAAMGMQGRMAAAWGVVNTRFLTAQGDLAERTATLAAISKTFRIFLQSLVLSVGAILVIEGKASAGIIFASSILSGRALAPIDAAIANWRGLVGARQAWARLNRLLAENPPPSLPTIDLPLPRRSLAVAGLTLAPANGGRACVNGVSFEAKAGDAIGLVGPSGAGKSSLLRGIVGVWAPIRGEVRLDDARIDQWAPDALGCGVGWLPQQVELFGGTVAQNIARLDPAPLSAMVIAAARAAGVHDLILRLPQGYDTPVGEGGAHLSAGQRQRIGLARALYGDPFLVVLDEPNSNLDPDGEAALATAIVAARQRGAIVLVATHRMAVLQAVNLVLVLRDGQVQTFGAREKALARPWPQPVRQSHGPQPAGAFDVAVAGSGR